MHSEVYTKERESGSPSALKSRRRWSRSFKKDKKSSTTKSAFPGIALHEDSETDQIQIGLLPPNTSSSVDSPTASPTLQRRRRSSISERTSPFSSPSKVKKYQSGSSKTPKVKRRRSRKGKHLFAVFLALLLVIIYLFFFFGKKVSFPHQVLLPSIEDHIQCHACHRSI